MERVAVRFPPRREERAPAVVTRPVPRARVQLHPKTPVCVRVRESAKRGVCVPVASNDRHEGCGTTDSLQSGILAVSIRLDRGKACT